MNVLHRWTFRFLCKAVRLLLKVRYKVEVRGYEKIVSLKQSSLGVLFLPNHPAEIDPVILMSIVGPDFFPRCIVVEHFYYLKWFRKILDFSRVKPIPCFEENVSVWKKKQVAQSLLDIQKEMEEGENYIIYPAGKLKRSAWEKIGGASFIYSLLQNQPKIPVVLIRTTGLWGSSFSTYGKNKSPDFGATLAQGVKAIIKGLFFFVPKRKIVVEFEVGENLPLAEDKLAFNRSLESWYNRYPTPGEEAVNLVPYVFWNKKVEPLIQQKGVSEEDFIAVSKEVETHVIAHLSALSKIPKEKIHQNSSLAFDLGLDSLDVADVHAFLDKEYDAGTVTLSSLQKVSDVLRAIVEKGESEDLDELEERKAITGWFESKQRNPLLFSEAEVIPQAFLDSCDRMGSLIACADASLGALSYLQCKRVALILAEQFRQLPEEKVGVLLPSSSMTYLSILALFLAGKVPVMLNWTAGRKGLNHAKELTKCQTTLTSKKFLNKIYLEDLGEIEETFLFLEDIKESLSMKKKLKGFVESFFSAKSLMKKFNISKDPSKVAVVLFTSGTESHPKAVPLQHKHILANQKSTLAVAGLSETDSLHGVLPPFHSFGFSLTGLFPLLCGLKVFYAPDPTEGKSMAFDIHNMKLTTVCLAPSFLRNLFASADIEQLQSLRLVVSGAEKPSPEIPIFVYNNLPLATWKEGYGITECSPIVSLQMKNGEPKGVGKLLSGIEVCMIDPITLEKRSSLEEGEICIRGPSVFEGYLDSSSSPFIEIAGKKWYRSGDLGHLDEEGNLYLTDRLKRTVKIGGEMISLGAVEQELLHAAKEKMWYTPSAHNPSDEAKSGPCLAVIAILSEKPELVLFTTLAVSVEEANRALRDKGAGRIVKIARVVPLTEIPLMGTGKVNYRALEEKIRCMNVSKDPSSSV